MGERAWPATAEALMRSRFEAFRADTTGIVEFRATYVAGPGDVGVQHERSLFVREHGRWYYVEGGPRSGRD